MSDSSSEDEFDELFSFSAATAATATSSAAKNKPVSTSPIDFDLSEQEDSTPVTTSAVIPSAESTSAHTSDTSSYVKVSPPTSDRTTPGTEEKNLEDDVLDDFNLDDVLKTNNHDEDDFHAMDADTREFLDFLDEPSKVTTEVKTSPADILEVDLDDDSDDDGLMDFVDIDDSNVEKPQEERIEKSTGKDNSASRAVKVEASPLANNAKVVGKKTSVETPIEKSRESPVKAADDEMQSTPISPAPMAPPPSAFPKILVSKPSPPKRESSTSSANPYQSNSILHAMDSTDSVDGSDDSEDEKGDEFAFAADVVPEVKAIVFDTLSEVIHSQDSTMNEVRSLLFPEMTELAKVENEERPWLWSKAICSRTLTDVQSSSLADSFTTWDETFDLESLQLGDDYYGLMESFVHRLLEEVEVLADRIVSSDSVDCDLMVTKKDLCSLLVFYYQSNFLSGNIANKSVEVEEDLGLDDSLVLEEDVEENVPMEFEKAATQVNEEESESKPKGHAVEWNSLIGPIATTLLASGTTPAVASVMMSRIIPSSMPLISLTQSERMQGVRTLHQKLYYLICYHLPLLVLHLDRCAPGWYWPQSTNDIDNEQSSSGPENATKKGRNLETRGIIPITWFSSHLAGEDVTEALEINKLLSLWDVLLTSNDHSLRFFLVLSLLERNSNNLLMLKGQGLVDELIAVMSFKRNDVEIESFSGDSTSAILSKEQEYVMIWTNHARSLRETTPFSVVEYLNKAEDEAVDYALKLRSKIAMEQMAARLEAEAEAHRRTMQEQNAKKLEERMHKYYKDRLDKYYQKHCPEKLDAVDKILEMYKDRYQILDNKLHLKYGRGFLPLISVFSPKVASQTGKMISNVNQGIEIKKKSIVAARAEERAKLYADEIDTARRKHQVAITVAASEIMPIVCGGKRAAKLSGTRESLIYYLVDSRPDGSLKIQGAFPTAARLSPEELMDPESIQEKVDMFESLRGAVHIVVMGEGFSAFPTLYNHPLDNNEQKLLDSDESRTNMCALFFIKKGFPFVSVLNGGFAAAHAWLARDGGAEKLPISEVLVDYDEASSLFADLERSYQEQKEFKSASARKKTTMAMQKLLDNSMTRLTIAENRIEDFTDRFISARKETTDKDSPAEEKEIPVKKGEDKGEGRRDEKNLKSPERKSIKSAFAGIRNRVKHTDENAAPEDTKAFDLSKISFGGKDKQEGEDKELKKFDFGKLNLGNDFKKLSFGRRTTGINPFGKKKADAALEREIDASLAPPANTKDEESKITNPQQNTNSKQETTKFKDAFSKLRGGTKTNSNISEPSGALREEEAILFEEDD